MDSKLSKKELLTSGILPKWHDATWEDFTADSRAKRIFQAYSSRAEEYLSDSAGLFIFGVPGVGKSLSANLIAKDLLIDKRTVRVISLGGLVDLMTLGWTDKDRREEYTQIIQRTQFLFIEDFGKEYYRKDEDGKSFATTVLEDCMVKRIAFKKPTFIISSIGAKEVKVKYSADLASLVLESCVPVKIEGGDYRTVIQGKLTKKYKSQ